jgi:DNA-binding IclR family transcriptional regulator
MSKTKQTKTEKVRRMLARPKGASLAAICKATGWQPHSARALLSGLRKAGYTIDRQAGETAGAGPIYRITAEPAGAE